MAEEPEFTAGESDSFYAWTMERKGRDYPVAYFNDPNVRDQAVALLNAATGLRGDLFPDGWDDDTDREVM